MKRAIKWNKPVEDKGGKVIRTSKCGRYQNKLGDAILACEQDNDPNWEPDDS